MESSNSCTIPRHWAQDTGTSTGGGSDGCHNLGGDGARGQEWARPSAGVGNHPGGRSESIDTQRGTTRRRAIRTIGVISDTHGLLRPEAVAALEGSALILHAGDVGDPEILSRLGEIAPVHAVRGNTDGGELRRMLPGSLVVDLGSADGTPHAEGLIGPLAYVHHGDRELDLDPRAAGIALVVSGHSHRPAIDERDGVVYLNPGSAGPRRFTLPVTVAKVWVEAGRIRAEIVEVVTGEGR
jgi:putative phosphoesterase